MVYSHIWDLLLKIALMVGLVVLSQSLHAEEWLRGIGVPAGYSVPTLVAIITVAWIAISRQVLSTIGAWLYARLSLRTDVSLNEARQLARLFQLDPFVSLAATERDQTASQGRTKECASG